MRHIRFVFVACSFLLAASQTIPPCSAQCVAGSTPAFQNGQAGLVDNCTKEFTPNKHDPQSDAEVEKPKNTKANQIGQDAIRQIHSNAEYAIWANDFKQRTYEAQLIQTRIIFVLVLILVGAGLFFSWMQFQQSLNWNRHVKNNVRPVGPLVGDKPAEHNDETPSNQDKDYEPSPETIKLGKDGVEIRSAYVGVIILALSMAFFFLYLKYVYPIS
jgi:hypothetical protein